MNNVYYVGSGELTFDLIERIINENLKLELAPEAKLRIQKNPCMALPPVSARCAVRAFRRTSWAPCRKISSRAMLAVWARRYARSSSN